MKDIKSIPITTESGPRLLLKFPALLMGENLNPKGILNPYQSMVEMGWGSTLSG